MAKRAGQDSKLLPPGTKAPDFTLHVTPDQTLALSDLAGKPIVLAFYPADSISGSGCASSSATFL